MSSLAYQIKAPEAGETQYRVIHWTTEGNSLAPDHRAGTVSRHDTRAEADAALEQIAKAKGLRLDGAGRAWDESEPHTVTEQEQQQMLRAMRSEWGGGGEV